MCVATSRFAGRISSYPFWEIDARKKKKKLIKLLIGFRELDRIFEIKRKKNICDLSL
jgi:hypothetical protein